MQQAAKLLHHVPIILSVGKNRLIIWIIHLALYPATLSYGNAGQASSSSVLTGRIKHSDLKQIDFTLALPFQPLQKKLLLLSNPSVEEILNDTYVHNGRKKVF